MLKVVWAMAFQVTFFRIGTVIANEVLYSTTCPLALARRWGFIVITSIQGASTYIAVLALFIYERRMKTELAEHKGSFKLLS